LYLFFPGLSIENKTKILAFINFLSAMLNLFFCLILVDDFGVVGIAVSTLVTSIFSFAINFYFSQKYYHIDLDRGLVFRITLIFVTCFFLTLSLNKYLIYSNLSIKILGIKMIFYLIVCLFIYFGVYRNSLSKLKLHC
jgi:O-antigen/teichoic acid export membrane protein